MNPALLLSAPNVSGCTEIAKRWNFALENSGFAGNLMIDK